MADRPARSEAESSGDELEITPEMIEAAWGISVSPDDDYSYRSRAYASIFAEMVLAADGPLAKISKVTFEGVLLGRRQA